MNKGHKLMVRSMAVILVVLATLAGTIWVKSAQGNETPDKADQARERIAANANAILGKLDGTYRQLFSMERGDDGSLEVMNSSGSTRCIVVNSQTASCFDTRRARVGAGGSIAFTADGRVFVSGYAPGNRASVIVTVDSHRFRAPVHDHYYLARVPVKVVRNDSGFPIMPSVQISDN